MTKRVLLPLCLLAVAGGLAWWFVAGRSPQRTELRAREVATWGLANYLAGKYPGSRVLVVSNPFSQRPGVSREFAETEEAGLRGTRLGLGTKAVLEAVAFPALKPGAETDPRAWLQDADTTTPLSYLVTEDSFDTLAGQHPACDLLVSLVGLPADPGRTEIWRKPGPPHLALLLPDLRIIGDAAAVRQAVQSGKLAAFVLPKPGGAGAAAGVGGQLAGEFAKRFVLVTAENIEEMMAAHPSLFPAN